MKARELAEWLLRNPDQRVFVCDEIACPVCEPISAGGTTYLLPFGNGLPHEIPEAVKDIHRRRRSRRNPILIS